MRAFVALLIPEEVQDALARLQVEVPVGRLVPEENLHLTLVFLGDLNEAALGLVHAALSEVSAPPIQLSLAGLGTFGGKSPRTLHVGATGPEALQAQVLRKLRAAGLELERRRFRPHITLARFGHRLSGHDTRRLADFLGHYGALALPPVTCVSFALMSSHLHPDGARYEVLAEYPLAG